MHQQLTGCETQHSDRRSQESIALKPRDCRRVGCLFAGSFAQLATKKRSFKQVNLGLPINLAREQRNTSDSSLQRLPDCQSRRTTMLFSGKWPLAISSASTFLGDHAPSFYNQQARSLAVLCSGMMPTTQKHQEEGIDATETTTTTTPVMIRVAVLVLERYCCFH